MRPALFPFPSSGGDAFSPVCPLAYPFRTNYVQFGWRDSTLRLPLTDGMCLLCRLHSRFNTAFQDSLSLRALPLVLATNYDELSFYYSPRLYATLTAEPGWNWVYMGVTSSPSPQFHVHILNEKSLSLKSFSGPLVDSILPLHTEVVWRNQADAYFSGLFVFTKFLHQEQVLPAILEQLRSGLFIGNTSERVFLNRIVIGARADAFVSTDALGPSQDPVTSYAAGDAHVDAQGLLIVPLSTNLWGNAVVVYSTAGRGRAANILRASGFSTPIGVLVVRDLGGVLGHAHVRIDALSPASVPVLLKALGAVTSDAQSIGQIIYVVFGDGITTSSADGKSSLSVQVQGAQGAVDYTFAGSWIRGASAAAQAVAELVASDGRITTPLGIVIRLYPDVFSEVQLTNPLLLRAEMWAAGLADHTSAGLVSAGTKGIGSAVEVVNASSFALADLGSVLGASTVITDTAVLARASLLVNGLLPAQADAPGFVFSLTATGIRGAAFLDASADLLIRALAVSGGTAYVSGLAQVLGSSLSIAMGQAPATAITQTVAGATVSVYTAAVSEVVPYATIMASPFGVVPTAGKKRDDHLIDLF